MNTYKIENTISGASLGEYQALSENEALDIMARDAGYHSFDDLKAQVSIQANEILLTRIIEKDAA